MTWSVCIRNLNVKNNGGRQRGFSRWERNIDGWFAAGGTNAIRLARMVNEMRIATEEAACPIETTAFAPCSDLFHHPHEADGVVLRVVIFF